MPGSVDSPPMYRVRVWFGNHAIADHTAEPAMAERFEAAMRRRFAGLRVTRELVVGQSRRWS